MAPELKSCVDNLEIQSVILKSLLVNLRDDVDAEVFDDECIEHPQEIRALKLIRQFQREEDDTWFYRLHTVIAIRFISEEDTKKDSGDDSIEPILEIRAEFVAQYESKCELSEEGLSLFGEKYVFYHVWPYWREILQSSCARLGVPPLMISPLRVS
ncbi:hypothetical protein [Pseudoalteromonas sp. T1lg21]|uniref:hypothetical protein n=1 Tax=Pseudoalteromonas sp. T1lg21 TaxID=2077095 RepID=UPI000CF7073C|nr:hypothetical protein [Pseudoalteromonas sp. T1lg21]